MNKMKKAGVSALMLIVSLLVSGAMVTWAAKDTWQPGGSNQSIDIAFVGGDYSAASQTVSGQNNDTEVEFYDQPYTLNFDWGGVANCTEDAYLIEEQAALGPTRTGELDIVINKTDGFNGGRIGLHWAADGTDYNLAFKFNNGTKTVEETADLTTVTITGGTVALKKGKGAKAPRTVCEGAEVVFTATK